ncbi:MAG: hypothetical protein RIT27_1791 [Pseudomonadota bacterium]|jgi:lipoprotein NlpD
MKIVLAFAVVMGVVGCAVQPPTPLDSPPKTVKTPPSPDVVHYRVRRGDTLFNIARRYGLKAAEIATWNALSAPYRLQVGQLLRLLKQPVTRSTPRFLPSENCSQPVQWQLPTSGRIIRTISRNGRQGIEIYGNFSQTVFAAADGQVAYSGNGVQGYTGGLIILNHSTGWRSVYAHNQQRLVTKDTFVKRGQPIATLGVNQRRRPVLHFEIRCGRNTLNPLLYLSGN